jgi:hypothetical protein
LEPPEDGLPNPPPKLLLPFEGSKPPLPLLLLPELFGLTGRPGFEELSELESPLTQDQFLFLGSELLPFVIGVLGVFALFSFEKVLPLVLPLVPFIKKTVMFFFS